MLLVAMVGGSSVLVWFGLTLADIRIAGGLLVTATAWQLMRPERVTAERAAFVGSPSTTLRL